MKKKRRRRRRRKEKKKVLGPFVQLMALYIFQLINLVLCMLLRELKVKQYHVIFRHNFSYPKC